MSRPPPKQPPDAIELIPSAFQAGAHMLTIAMTRERRWTVAVDGTPLPATFDTQVEAWEAGVHEADRLGSGPPPAAS